MYSKLLLTLAAAALTINAQDFTLTPCARACLVSAGATSNCDYPSTNCFCGSAQFIADGSACLKAHCSDDDITAAMYFQAAMCGGNGVTATDRVTTTHSVPFSLPSTSSGASATSVVFVSGHGAINPSTTPATYSSAPASTPSKAASSGLQAQSGAGAVIGAVLAGILAL